MDTTTAVAEDTVSIDRERVRAAFETYLAPYDRENPRIALKAEHTYRVADLCDRIARASGFTQAGADLAWLCGLLHAIGRFEQLRRWGTFKNSMSASHAAIGVDVLFEGGRHLFDGSLARVNATLPEALSHDDEFLAYVRTAGTVRAFIEDPSADEYPRSSGPPQRLSPSRRPRPSLARALQSCALRHKIDILRVSCRYRRDRRGGNRRRAARRRHFARCRECVLRAPDRPL